MAVADLLLSCLLLAFTVTVEGDGTEAGAVYKPLEDTVPQELPVQPVPVTVHVTAVFEVPETLAVNC